MPATQVRIPLPTRDAYADFAYPERKLVIEVLGYEWHGGKERWESDLTRSSELAALGWRILYITKRQLQRERAATAARIRQALGIEPLF